MLTCIDACIYLVCNTHTHKVRERKSKKDNISLRPRSLFIMSLNSTKIF